MPSVSKAQQRFMGATYACQKGGKCISPEVSKAAHSMERGDVKDFASTSHDGLPEKYMEIIREELAEYLKEMNAVPCGSCGKQCPCEDACESPKPTGMIVNGKVIQFAPKSECGCNSEKTPQTPQMPENQVSQFGNTPKMGEFDKPSGNERLFNVPELHLSFLKRILTLLKNKKREPAEYQGQQITLYKPELTDEHIKFYIKKENIVKEVKIPKKRKNK